MSNSEDATDIPTLFTINWAKHWDLFIEPKAQLDPAGLPLPTRSGTMIRPRALGRPLCTVAAMLTVTVSEVHEPAGGGGGGGGGGLTLAVEADGGQLRYNMSVDGELWFVGLRSRSLSTGRSRPP